MIAQLVVRRNGNGELPWSTGCADLEINYQVGNCKLHTAVACKFGSLRTTELALLDTGAEYSIIGSDIINAVSSDLGPIDLPMTMSTRVGRMEGALRRLAITLVANTDCGVDLTVQATVFATQDWAHPPVLGFRGFLEWIHLALEPGQDNPYLYFGKLF